MTNDVGARRSLASWIVGLGFLAGCVAGDEGFGLAASDGAPGALAFVGVHVLPMTDVPVLLDQTVVIEGGRVTAIGPVDLIPIPEGGKVIPAEGRYLLPGLVDAHVHLLGSGAKQDLRLYPPHGITSIVNMRGEPVHQRWREEVGRGEVFGPDIYNSGPFVDAVGAPPEAEELVRSHEELGYDLIKIRGELEDAELRALVDGARGTGIVVSGHVSGSTGVAGALRAGQGVIEHAEGLLQTFFEGRIEPHRLIELAELFDGASTCVTPTLVVYEYVVRQTEEYPDLRRLLARPELSYLDPELVHWWQPERNGYVTRWRGREAEVPGALDRFRRELGFLKAITRALYDAGVTLMAGTDASVAFVVPGISLHEELRLLREAGLPPLDVLRAATVGPSRCYPWLAEYGTVEVGKRANLLLVEADPMEDLSTLMEPVGLVLRGEWIDAADLRALLPR